MIHEGCCRWSMHNKYVCTYACSHLYACTLIKYSLLMSVIRLIYHVLYYCYVIEYFIWLGFCCNVIWASGWVDGWVGGLVPRCNWNPEKWARPSIGCAHFCHISLCSLPLPLLFVVIPGKSVGIDDDVAKLLNQMSSLPWFLFSILSRFSGGCNFFTAKAH